MVVASSSRGSGVGVVVVVVMVVVCGGGGGAGAGGGCGGISTVCRSAEVMRLDMNTLGSDLRVCNALCS